MSKWCSGHLIALFLPLLLLGREIQSIFLQTIGERVQQSGGVIDCEIMTYIAVELLFLIQFLGRWVLDQERFQLILCLKNECNLFPIYKLGLYGELKI